MPSRSAPWAWGFPRSQKRGARAGGKPSAHIKDFDAIHRDAKSPGRIVELGHGVIDDPPIVKAALETGVQHLFVEHDPPGGVPIPMDGVQREGRYLRTLCDHLPTVG